MITTFVNIVKALYYTIACYRYNSFPDDNRRGTFLTYGFLYIKEIRYSCVCTLFQEYLVEYCLQFWQFHNESISCEIRA